MLWSEVLSNWENGIPFTYPERLQNGDRFHWNTSPLTKDMDTLFSEKFKENTALPKRQNKSAFIENIEKAEKNGKQHATSFPNLSGDTILVVPMPKNRKSYATLKDFTDNAPKKQQQELWKLVAKEAKKQSKKLGKVWISTHGLGVPYLHVRISGKPKYYFSKTLAEK
tara:strand:- start:40 stop:543 length:504 start_codon:yes stop_codon:yes gene_type:complete